ncbi:MAG: Cys-tRNA(Pro) deacylase [Oscillospiraceae bacterium]|nr:Cys-tRNA(Pro) deacylase [Oscillospiraceae bacterium]
MLAGKEIKTNAMRMLDKSKIPYKANFYTCEEFIDGIHIADMLSQPYEQSFKTLVLVGKSGKNYVFVIPINKELDLKAAAKCVGEKNIEMLHVKDIKDVTGYIRGGCTAIGMKKPYPTVIDSSCKQFDEIIVSGGAIGVQLFMTPENFIKASGAKTDNITI